MWPPATEEVGGDPRGRGRPPPRRPRRIAVWSGILGTAACVGGVTQEGQVGAAAAPIGHPTSPNASEGPKSPNGNAPTHDSNQSQSGGQRVTSPYAPGSILPTASQQADLDAVLSRSYASYLKRFIGQAGCPATYAYVDSSGDTATAAITVSEAHGYGMLILALMGAQDPNAQGLFDKMVALWQASPSAHTPGLMAWQLESGCRVAAGTGSAADGDLDMAYALLMADKTWGSSGAIPYAQLGRSLAATIMRAEVDPAHAYAVQEYDAMTPGDPHLGSTRLSDAAMVEHFRVFARAGGDANWLTTRATSVALIAHLQTTFSPTMGVVPDFATNLAAGGQPAAANFLESANDGNYFYNACRVPWRLSMDFLLHGSQDVLPLVARLNKGAAAATAGVPTRLGKGYTLAGAAIAPGWTYAFLAPFAVAAMVDASNQSWLDAMWQLFAAQDFSSLTYYEASIAMLCLVVLTGHWPVLPV